MLHEKMSVTVKYMLMISLIVSRIRLSIVIIIILLAQKLDCIEYTYEVGAVLSMNPAGSQISPKR